MTKRRRSVLIAVLLITLCVAMAAVGTYALFTDDVGVTTHLKAGNLDATLERIDLHKWSLDPKTGCFIETKSDEIVDFSAKTERNVFDMSDEELIVPLCSYTAKMRITNNSDVAFRYWIEIVFDDSENLELADQLYVTVKSVNGTAEGYLSEVAKLIGTEQKPISTLTTEKGKNSECFTISIEFKDLDDKVNNGAMNQSAKVDVIVRAVQVVPEKKS